MEDVKEKFSEIKELASSSRKELKTIANRLRQEHSSDIALYKTAVRFLRVKSEEEKLPNLKTLKTEKAKLLEQKESAKEKYHYYQDYQKKLNTVRTNIHTALGQQPSRSKHKKEHEDIS